MNINFNRVSESHFENIKSPVLFENKLTDRAFAVVSNDFLEYKFAWSSDKVNPVIKYFDSICLIGVDLNFVILDFSIKKIIFNFKLDYYFYDLKLYGNYIYLISEFEVFKIRKDDFFIEKIYNLPDTFENIDFNNDSIIVSCVNDYIVDIK